jgi:large subunit ribosomal protein L35
MPKMKTNKAVASRFKVTASGKLLRRHPGKRHKLSKKTSKNKRFLGAAALVDASQVKMYKRMMCV